MRIAIGGIMHESNTFAPSPTDRRRFEEGSLTRGEALLPVWRDAHHEIGRLHRRRRAVRLRARADGRWPGPRRPGRSTTT